MEQKIILDESQPMFSVFNRLVLINGLTAIHLSDGADMLKLADFDVLHMCGKLARYTTATLEIQSIPPMLVPFIHAGELWAKHHEL